MAATARRIAAVLAVATLGAIVLHGDETSEALAAVHRAATALSAGNPIEAIAQFDRSYPDYEKLKNYFIGLTGAYNIVSEASIVDEHDEPGAVNMTLDWTLTLTQADSSLSKRRTGEIHVRVIRIKGKWKIASFSPIEIFDPAISNP